MPTNTEQGFGIEIECYLPEGRSMEEAARAVSARIGEPVNVESYNHSARPAWKVVTDGSLNGGRGCEFVSPILRGDAGLAQLEAVCDALTDFGCTVNRSCGLHVHVGVADARLAFFKNITKLYALYEPVIDGMMPASRRASANMYCRSMTAAAPAQIDRANSLQDIVTTVCGSIGRESRYYKLNLTAYARHRTVEFRQHSGTLDARKARTWAELCIKMVSAAARGINFGGSIASAERPRNRARAGTKVHTVVKMLLRPEGATRTEINAAVNWPSISISQIAERNGLTITTQRTGREVRYLTNAAQATDAPAEITIPKFCELIGASAAEQTFIETRTRNLSGPVQWAA
jgi:hypothetical protein